MKAIVIRNATGKILKATTTLDLVVYVAPYGVANVLDAKTKQPIRGLASRFACRIERLARRASEAGQEIVDWSAL